MVRGFYSAASGILTQQKSINVISNNISNAMTAGYKSQSTIESSFGEHLVSRMGPNSQRDIGSGSFITVNISEHTDFTQGALENTGRSVDMAILGEGFFLIESQEHGEVLTRNGQFEIDKDGDLVLPDVGKVLDHRRREINLEVSNFNVDRNGNISVDGKEIATLFICDQDGEYGLTRVGPGTYRSQEGYGRADNEQYSIIQGSIEKSNVNMAKEMSGIIAGQSKYQSCAQILKIYDSINEICVNRIGEVR